MSDFLVELGANPKARKAIGKIGLPIPLPQKLRRATGPWEERPLQDLPVVTAQAAKAELTAVVAHALAAAGANISVTSAKAAPKPYLEEAEAWGRPPAVLKPGETPEGFKPHGLVYDATGMAGPEELKGVYEFFHLWVRKLAPCGRAVILGRTVDEAQNPLVSAANRALEGFVKSMGREIGGKGSTAQVIYVDQGAEERVEPFLRFVLSERSAYVTGQPIHVSAKVAAEGAPAFIRPLEGKVALVTGSARGIGAATARALAREGAHVIVMDRPSEDGPASVLADELKGTLLLCDITDAEAPKAAAKLVKEKFGKLDVVVHNAGVTRDKTLANMDEARWDSVLGVNLLSLIRLNEGLTSVLAKGARVVCLSSIGGIAGNMGQTNYAASKAGVIGYIRAVAPTLAAKGIAVNAVAPGFIETQMTAAIPAATREVARRLCNLSQGGLPEDVAEVIAFLASPGAAGMCGEVLRICGGNYIGA